MILGHPEKGTPGEAPAAVLVAVSKPAAPSPLRLRGAVKLKWFQGPS